MKSRLLVVFILSLHLGPFAPAEVVRVEILERRPFADGHEFGPAGAYEKIAGRLHCEVDPADAAQAPIADIQLAPRNERGRVEFRTDFFLLKPVDARRGNGRLLYDVNNRGNKLALWTFNEARGNNPTTPADAGNGFLMRNGWSVLWCGWSGEVAPGENRLVAELPPVGPPVTVIVWMLASPFSASSAVPPIAAAVRVGFRATIVRTRPAPTSTSTWVKWP